MTIKLDDKGFRSIANGFDLYFIDIWGVIHNGISLHKEAIEVLEKLEKLKKKYILLTNAPRPNINVRNFLEKMGLNRNKSSNVYTSGESALSYLKKKYIKKKFYHVGPPRDFDLFKLLKKNKVNEIEKSEYLLCTGLFDNHEKDLDYYKNLFKNQNKKVMICTNPDLIVDRGSKREYCAGTVAKLYEEIGGKVEYFGKPYENVYKLSTKINTRKVLCIGDNLKTDILGANKLNYKSLLITSGIHRNEINKNNNEKLFKKYNVKVDYTQSSLKW